MLFSLFSLSHHLSTTVLIKLIPNTKKKSQTSIFGMLQNILSYKYTHGKLSIELIFVSLLSIQTHVKCFRSFYLLLLLRVLSLLGIPSKLSLHACQVIHPLIGSQTNECLHKSLFTWLVEWILQDEADKGTQYRPSPHHRITPKQQPFQRQPALPHLFTKEILGLFLETHFLHF